MKKLKNIFIVLISLTLFISVYLYVAYNFSSSEKNLEHINSEVLLSSNDLVANFLSNKKEANKLYTDKIIEVTGYVEEVTFLNNRKTVLLYTENKKSGIICDINKNEIEKVNQLKKHQQIMVKGVCKGFLKDVILLNCYLDLKPND